jgi:hypothetical protein
MGSPPRATPRRPGPWPGSPLQAAPKSRGPQPVSVAGGVGGIAAHCDEIVAMAGRFGGAGGETMGAAAALHGYLLHPAIVLSATIDPVGFAVFEADLLAALDGWRGLSWAGLACGAIDAELRAAAGAYEAADRLGSGLHDAFAGALDAGPALALGAEVLARTGDPIRAAEAAVVRDPEAADTVVDLLGIPATLHLLGAALADGHGVVRAPGIDRTGVAGRPPRRLTDLIRDLAQRNGDARHGEIDVRVMTMPDGSRRAIVDITGTKSWTPLPTTDVTSLTTNGRALVGESTAYEGGVLVAMREAGLTPTDDVMIVGHSEGGMVAVTAARDAVRTGAFRITHVVTAGSPIGRTVRRLPTTVKVLALENSRDVVPHLDGVANPDKPNVTTASAPRGDGTIGGDHDITGAYLPLARDAQASQDRSIREFLSSAKGFFQATKVETHTYQIQRRY